MQPAKRIWPSIIEYREEFMRFLLRFASLVALVVAVVAGTIDSIQSVAASAVVMTPMGMPGRM